MFIANRKETLHFHIAYNEIKYNSRQQEKQYSYIESR